MNAQVHRSSKWRKRKTNFMSLTTLFVSDKSNVRMKSNLPTEYKRMHKFTEVANGEKKNKFHVTHHTFYQNDKSYEVVKSNLPT